MLDTGDTLRWIVEIDGKDVPDLDARVESHPERSGVMVMSLVRGDEENCEVEELVHEEGTHMGPQLSYGLSATFGDVQGPGLRQEPNANRDKPLHVSDMRMRGLEPPRAFAHTDLNRARLPIPPHPLGGHSVAVALGAYTYHFPLA